MSHPTWLIKIRKPGSLRPPRLYLSLYHKESALSDTWLFMSHVFNLTHFDVGHIDPAHYGPDQYDMALYEPPFAHRTAYSKPLPAVRFRM
jgi:hypothetical protein